MGAEADMYDTGAWVQEILDLRLCDIRLDGSRFRRFLTYLWEICLSSVQDWCFGIRMFWLPRDKYNANDVKPGLTETT